MLGNNDGRLENENIRVSHNKIAISKFDTNPEIEHNGILIANKSTEGFKAIEGCVLSIGVDAVELTGLSIGDVIRFDQCSVLYDTNPVVVINDINVILKVEDDKPVPLKDQVFVEKIGTWVELHSELDIPERNSDISVGIVTCVTDDSTVSVGDKIIMTTECDVIDAPTGKFYIYRNENILATC
jgi:hypothetical protein